MDQKLRGRLHRPVITGVMHALDQVFNQKRYAKLIVENIGKKEKSWGARDRRLFAEILYDVVRWWRKLLLSAGIEWSEEYENQVVVASAIENRYTEEVIWRVIEAWMITRGVERPDWFASQLEASEVDEGWQANRKSLGSQFSLTDWMAKSISAELGGETEQLFASINQPAPFFIRVNLTQITAQDLVKRLTKLGEIVLSPCANSTAGFQVQSQKSLFQTEDFKSGFFEVQDINSQKVAFFMDVQVGQRVIDACAGAGGKTLHIADLMKGKGTVIAMDIYEGKLKKLVLRGRRAQYSNIETRCIIGTKTIKRLKASADRVLLDVPCSGTGVLRRNPDTKWKMSQEQLDRLLVTQGEIIEKYSAMVKPGGKLVYSTCSILSSENEDQVRNFLAAHEEKWSLEAEHRYGIGEDGGDGFYMAKLKCNS